MKITKKKLVWYAMLRDQLEEVALEFNLTTQDAPEDIGAHDINDIDVDLERKVVHVSGDTYYRGCTDYFSMLIPFKYFEDPVVWEEEWEAARHQELLNKIQARSDKEKKDAENLEAHDKAEYERLKEKYSE